MKMTETTGKLFCGISVPVLPIAFLIACLAGETAYFGIGGFLSRSWILFLFLPLEAFLIVCTVKGREKITAYRLKVVVAGVVCFLLLALGLTGSVFSPIDQSNLPIKIAEEKTGAYLPDDVKVITLPDEACQKSYAKLLTSDEKNAMAAEVLNEERWVAWLGAERASVLPFDVRVGLERFDYYMLYNITKDTYNQYLKESGDYDFVFVAYNESLGRLLILTELSASVTVSDAE